MIAVPPLRAILVLPQGWAMLMCGLGIVAVPAGLIAAALSKVLREEDRE